MTTWHVESLTHEQMLQLLRWLLHRLVLYERLPELRADLPQVYSKITGERVKVVTE